MERLDCEVVAAIGAAVADLESERNELAWAEDGWAGLSVDTLESAGLKGCRSRLERSVTSMAGSLMGPEKGETGTEPVVLGTALPAPYELSAVRWSDWEEGAVVVEVEVDLARL